MDNNKVIEICKMYGLNPIDILTDESEELLREFIKANIINTQAEVIKIFKGGILTVPAAEHEYPVKLPIGTDKKAKINITIDGKSIDEVIKATKRESDKIIVLKAPVRVNYDKSHCDSLEEEYSKKFGCKVIILRDGLELTGVNNG